MSRQVLLAALDTFGWLFSNLEEHQCGSSLVIQFHEVRIGRRIIGRNGTNCVR